MNILSLSAHISHYETNASHTVLKLWKFDVIQYNCTLTISFVKNWYIKVWITHFRFKVSIFLLFYTCKVIGYYFIWWCLISFYCLPVPITCVILPLSVTAIKLPVLHYLYDIPFIASPIASFMGLFVTWIALY